MKKIKDSFNKLLKDYSDLQEDIDNVTDYNDIHYFIDSTECHNYVFLNETVNDFSYSTEVDIITNLTVHNSILDLLLTSNKMQIGMLPGHEVEYNSLRNSLAPYDIFMLKQAINIIIGNLDKDQEKLTKIAKDLSNTIEKGQLTPDNLSEVIKSVLEIAPSLIAYSLQDDMKPKKRFDSLIKNFQLTRYNYIANIQNSSGSNSVDIEEYAKKFFKRRRRNKHSANLYDSKVFSFIKEFTTSFDSKKIVFVTRAPLFFEAAKELEAKFDFPFSKHIRHPRYFISKLLAGQDFQQLKSHALSLNRDLSEGSQYLRREIKKGKKTYHVRDDVNEKQLVELQQKVVDFEDKLRFLGYFASHKERTLAQSFPQIDVEKFINILTNTDSLFDAVSDKAVEALSDISHSFYGISVETFGKTEVSTMSKAFRKTYIYVSQYSLDEQLGIKLFDYISISDRLVPVSLGFASDAPRNALVGKNSKKRDLHSVVSEARDYFPKDSEFEYRLFLAYLFGIVCRWDVALAFCDWAIRDKDSVVIDADKHEAYYFRAFCRRCSSNDVSNTELESSLKDISKALQLVRKKTKIDNLWPARYLIELGSLVAIAEKTKFDFEQNEYPKDIPLSPLHIWDKTFSTEAITSTENFMVLNRIAFHLVSNKDFEKPKTEIEKIARLLESLDMGLKNLPANILHTVALVKAGKNRVLSEPEKLTFTEIWTQLAQMPIQAMYSEKKVLFKEMDELTKGICKI